MDTRIGTCSECGGAVVTSGYMNAVHCIKCGAIPRGAPGVIPMRQPSVNLRPRMPRPAHLTWIEDMDGDPMLSETDAWYSRQDN